MIPDNGCGVMVVVAMVGDIFYLLLVFIIFLSSFKILDSYIEGEGKASILISW